MHELPEHLDDLVLYDEQGAPLAAQNSLVATHATRRLLLTSGCVMAKEVSSAAAYRPSDG